MKSLLIYALILIGYVYGDEIENEYIRNEYDFELIDSLVIEEPCSEAGGTCTIAADCPHGSLSETKGLCPKQQSKGVDCCYGLSMKETRCHKRGGICISTKEYCSAKLVFTPATDCPEDHKCCIMVD